ncbi:MAG: type II and III secretion system protein family protein [Deltaproteobacteria bacterium]|nr:MAG: type II and III secretion system protein family protein [Deltaproteobacteria bacterium]
MRTDRLYAAAIAVAAWLPCAAFAGDDAPRRIDVHVASSRYLALGDRITSVAVASKDVAEVAAFPPDQLLVTGKTPGTTTATVWHGQRVEVLVIDVTYDLDAVRDALRDALPGAENIDVRQAGTALALAGRVAAPADVDRAEEIVAGYAPGAAIVNLMTVAGDQQVQLEVSFAEVSRSALKEIGFNFWSKAKRSAGGLMNPATNLESLSPQANTSPGIADLNTAADGATPLVATPLSGAFGAIFSTTLGEFPFSAALSILSNKGYARVLAEPTLVAMSGQSASFLAGGEFPIPLPQSLGNIGVEYKKFGIQLEFTPTVIGDTIQVGVGVTVSDVDFSLGLKLEKVTVPGLTSRHAETTVRVKDGQSFVIAGLLSDKVRSNVDKVPWLGDLPVLGALFRSSSYRRDETELLVVVTAHRVRPLDERPELPGEFDRVDPSDLELFFLGRAESLPGGAPPRRRAPKHKPVGAVGFQR